MILVKILGSMPLVYPVVYFNLAKLERIIHTGSMTQEQGGGDPPFLSKPETSPPSVLAAHHRAAKVCGGLAFVGASFVGGALGGSMLIPTEVQLGPHRAELTLTFDSSINFDLGPVGGKLPVDSPLGMGTKVAIKGIPLDQGNGKFSLSGQGLERYAAFFGNIEPDVKEARSRLWHHALKYGALVAGGALLVGATVSEVLVGRRRRQELDQRAAEIFSSRGARALLATGLLAGNSLALVAATHHQHVTVPRTVSTGHIFDHTPLEGLRVSDEISATIAKAAPPIIEAIDKNDAFYNQVISNLEQAFADKQTLRPFEGQHMLVFYSDLHCNPGMARVIGKFAELANATIVVDGGDTTISGSEIEDACVRVLASGLPKHVKKVVSLGNHDSAATESQMRKAGFTVLDGKAISVNGLKILGDSDPMRSVIGSRIRQRGKETVPELGQRLAQQACQDKPGILLIHTPGAAEATLQAGCTNLALSGHIHHEVIGRVISTDGRSILHLVADNASGSLGDSPSVGPLQSTTHLYLMKVNKKTEELSFYQDFAFNPDASVDVGETIYVEPPASS